MMKQFDFETIAVNKRGEKTKKQIKDMKFSTNPMIWGGVGLLLFGIYAFLASAVNPNLWNSAWWVLPVLEFIPLIRGYAFWKARRKLLNDKVVSVTGTIAYSPSAGYVGKSDDGRTVYSLLIRNLPPGKYRFYHLEQEKDGWLSIEPLDNEAEFRANLNDALASEFGYNREHLEYCKRQAGAAALKTAEGLLKIHVKGDEYGPDILEGFTVGKVTFNLANKNSIALLENLPYRVYYRELEEEETRLKQVVKLVKSRKLGFEAIEAL